MLSVRFTTESTGNRIDWQPIGNRIEKIDWQPDKKNCIAICFLTTKTGFLKPVSQYFKPFV